MKRVQGKPVNPLNTQYRVMPVGMEKQRQCNRVYFQGDAIEVLEQMKSTSIFYEQLEVDQYIDQVVSNCLNFLGITPADIDYKAPLMEQAEALVEGLIAHGLLRVE